MKDNVYLAIHGHFYQPPRENPWLEYLETQDSAAPAHDWNERIDAECYTPNSVSRIIDNRNMILNIVNNYTYINFNIGPTLLSWLEKYSPLTYKRIQDADKQSVLEHEGHGNAIAQVYNHIIMPLANERDKQTQVKWGIKDFETRFGRKPEGMWLAETAADDDTLRVLVENGIKYTILSPYQAQKIKDFNSNDWQDVSWGNIDPARPYRYYIKTCPDKYIDIFFYDGAISKSVAFDEILKDGQKFIKRLKEGVSDSRDFPQLINIATDGESYGHHTKFGDMALAYIMKVMAEDEGFKIVNYAQFLAKFPPTVEVDIKQGSSWSCFHGVGRWKEDCGCSTGGYPGWNQKWRKPLRDAFDYLRDELSLLFEKEGSKYMKDPWNARNNYIDVILDRNEENVLKFQKDNFIENLSDNEKILGMKLLEIQRQALLMYTSCGWFFSDISGIETVQILKYAARAMEIAKDFSSKNLEENFLDILDNAKSNIKECGSGKDIYKKHISPVSKNQIITLWAISSLFKDLEEVENLYCYKITKKDYKVLGKSKFRMMFAHIEVRSDITLEKSDLVVALFQYSSGDFHCAIKPYVSESDWENIEQNLTQVYMSSTIVEILRTFDEIFGNKYYTIKDVFLEERRKALQTMLKGKIQKFDQAYQEMYFDSKSSIFYMQSLGLKIPDEFKILAKYTLSKNFNEITSKTDICLDKLQLQQALAINDEAIKIGVEFDKTPVSKLYSKKVAKSILYLSQNFNLQQAQIVMNLLNELDKLDLKVEIGEAQNIYYTKVLKRFKEIAIKMNKRSSEEEKSFMNLILKIGTRLNIDTQFNQNIFDKAILTD